MESIIIILSAFWDLFIRLTPRFRKKNGYAFLVHARGMADVYRRFPFFKILPKRMVEWVITYMWPIVVSEITGLKSQETQLPVKGWLIGFPMTAKQMMEQRGRALKKIVQSVTLAEKMGAEIVGLGALTSSLSKGGVGYFR